MTPSGHERQLELFDLAHGPAPRPYREAVGRVQWHLRYDQLILAAIAGVMGLTVVFASGVERGKQLARTERPMLPREEATSAPSAAPGAVASPAVIPQPISSTPSAKAQKKSPPMPASSPKGTTPSKVAAGKSRYAIQVVTFSRPLLAKKELERLQARGERAFLVMRDGRTSVYVGPFPSKINASEKLTVLKPLYQDCFMRLL